MFIERSNFVSFVREKLQQKVKCSKVIMALFWLQNQIESYETQIRPAWALGWSRWQWWWCWCWYCWCWWREWCQNNHQLSLLAARRGLRVRYPADNLINICLLCSSQDNDDIIFVILSCIMRRMATGLKSCNMILARMSKAMLTRATAQNNFKA